MASGQVNASAAILQLTTSTATPLADWKNVVCMTDYDLDISRDANSVATNCGTLRSTGTPDMVINVNGIVPLTVTTASELSFAELLTSATTAVTYTARIYAVNGASDVYYIQAPVIVTNLTKGVEFESGQVSFSATLELTGQIITTRPA